MFQAQRRSRAAQGGPHHFLSRRHREEEQPMPRCRVACFVPRCRVPCFFQTKAVKGIAVLSLIHGLRHIGAEHLPTAHGSFGKGFSPHCADNIPQACHCHECHQNIFCMPHCVAWHLRWQVHRFVIIPDSSLQSDYFPQAHSLSGQTAFHKRCSTSGQVWRSTAGRH